MKSEINDYLKLSIHNKTQLCQYYLHSVYEQVQYSFLNRKKKTIAEKQGEILYSGISKLLSVISLSKQDVFFDLGSGLGKIVFQVFLNTEVQQASGIEISSELHQQACLVAQRIQLDLPDFYTNNRKVNFVCGDFLDISFASATVVLINSVCFSPTLLYSLGKIIDYISGIHTVFSSRPIPSMKRLKFIKAVRVECSWDTALCYIYQS